MIADSVLKKREGYENIVRRNVKPMNKANNWIVFVRVNHDNPAYFDRCTFKHKRFMAVPDYAIILHHIGFMATPSELA